jgi:tRNA (mo5U34)-methyltransferase
LEHPREQATWALDFESAMDTKELKQRIAKIPFWYHKIELPGAVTPGWQPASEAKKAAYRIPADLSGKRVLDVGAWDGFWTFEALKRGARQVVAIDDFSDFLGKLQNSERRAWRFFASQAISQNAKLPKMLLNGLRFAA